MVEKLLHLRLVILFITFVVDFNYIYGDYNIYGCYYIYGWYKSQFWLTSFSRCQVIEEYGFVLLLFSFPVHFKLAHVFSKQTLFFEKLFKFVSICLFQDSTTIVEQVRQNKESWPKNKSRGLNKGSMRIRFT